MGMKNQLSTECPQETLSTQGVRGGVVDVGNQGTVSGMRRVGQLVGADAIGSLHAQVHTCILAHGHPIGTNALSHQLMLAG